MSNNAGPFGRGLKKPMVKQANDIFMRNLSNGRYLFENSFRRHLSKFIPQTSRLLSKFIPQTLDFVYFCQVRKVLELRRTYVPDELLIPHSHQTLHVSCLKSGADYSQFIGNDTAEELHHFQDSITIGAKAV